MEKNNFLMFLLLCIVVLLFFLYKNKNEMMPDSYYNNRWCKWRCANNQSWYGSPPSQCMQECLISENENPLTINYNKRIFLNKYHKKLI